ncbi:MAG: pro-sigmaK processing inhibitor BofA family protein [Clostridiales bacterium]|nr:pro-sigmaK processing inhibitor BofA family protein [Clostridiales bacterium]
MRYEVILSYFIGFAAIIIAALLFSIKTKGLLGLLFNTALGGLVLTVLSLWTPLQVPLNPLTALLCGFMGVPGIGLILLIVYFL